MSFFQRLKNDLNPFDGPNQDKNSLANNSLTRGFSRVVDQVNPLDSGRSWQTRAPSQEQYQLSAVSQLGRQVAPNTGKFLNTANLAGRQAVEGGRMIGAMLTHNPNAGFAASQRADLNYNKYANPNSGVFNSGTFFHNADEAKRGDFKTVAQRIGGGTLGTFGEVAPMANSLRVTKGLPQLARMVGGNTAYGTIGSVGNQFVQNGKVDLKQTAKDVAMANVLGFATHGATKAVGKAGKIIGITKTSATPPVKGKQPTAEAIQAGNHADLLQKKYDNTTNPQTRKTISKQIAILNQQRGQTGGGFLGNEPTIKNMLGEDVPNPNYAPQVGKTNRTQLTGKQLDTPNSQLFQDPNGPEATAKARASVNKMQNPTDKQISYLNTTKKQILDEATRQIMGTQNPRNLINETLKQGGISSSAYETLPKGVKRNAGMSADRMAQVLGFADENAYVEALNNQTKPMKVSDARALAEQQLTQGQHPYSEDWHQANSMIDQRNLELQQLPQGAKEIKSTSQLPSEEEWMAMTGQAQAEGVPITKKGAAPIQSANRQKMSEAVKAGNYEEAARIRAEAATMNEAVRAKDSTYSKKPQEGAPELAGIKDQAKKQAFRQSTNDYLGSKAVSKTSAQQLVNELEQSHPLTDAQKLDALQVIDGVKQSTDTKVNAYVDAYRRTTDELYRHYTVDKKVDMGYQDQYLPRNYKNPATGEAITGKEYDLLMRSSGRMKSRTTAALDPESLISKDPNELLSKYITGMDSAVHGKDYFRKLEQDGFIVKSSEPVRGMKPITAEGMQDFGGVFYAKPEVADSLNKIFGSQPDNGVLGTTLDKTAGVAASIQDIVLSGGIPARPLNAFTLAQVTKEFTAGHPAEGFRALINSWKPERTTEFFNTHANSIKEIQQNGYNIRASLTDTGTAIERILGADNKGGMFKEAWNQMANDPTFGRFMPVLEIQKYESFKKNFIKKGLSEVEAQSKAVESMRNWTGKGDMYSQATSSKIGSDAATTFLFAPRYREAMINFWVKNAKAFTPENIKNPAFADNRRFVIGAMGTLVAMNAANYATTGNLMINNPNGKKDKLLIPIGKTDTGSDKYLGVPFLPSIATVPRNIAIGAYNLATGNLKEAGKNAASFLSIPARTATDLLQNENYFGGQIVDPEASPVSRLAASAAYVAKNNMHPYIREGLNVAGQQLPTGLKKSLGVQDIPLYQSASQAGELPLRFYDSQYFKGGSAPKNGVNAATESTTPKMVSIRSSTGKSKDVNEVIADSFATPEKRKFLSMSEDEQKNLASTDKNARKMYDELQSLKNTFGATKLRSLDLSPESQKILDAYDRRTPKQKEGVLNKDPKAEFDYAVAKYESDKLDGTITTKAEDIRRMNDLKKLKVGSSISKESRDMYSLGKQDVWNFISTDPNGKKYAEDLLKYGDAMEKAGLGDNKFRDKYGNPSFEPKSKTSGGKGGKKTISISKSGGMANIRKAMNTASASKGVQINRNSIIAKSNVKIKKNKK